MSRNPKITKVRQGPLPVAFCVSQDLIYLYNPDKSLLRIYKEPSFIGGAVMCYIRSCRCDACDACIVGKAWSDFNDKTYMRTHYYVWNEQERCCYATPQCYVNRHAEQVLACVGELGPEHPTQHGTHCGTQRDLEWQLQHQPWWRPEFTFPILTIDPIPF